MKEISDWLIYRQLPFSTYWDEAVERFNSSGGLAGGGLGKTVVKDKKDIDAALAEFFSHVDWEKTGIMLSGGIDSALVASYAPKGTLAFTIKYPEIEGVDETARARLYAEKLGLRLVEVPVTFQDVLDLQDDLMLNKREPLQAIEVPILKICLRALDFGLENLVTGLGADIRFGGDTMALAKDRTKEEYIEFQRFVDPDLVLKGKVDQDLSIFDKYEKDGKFDVFAWLHGELGKGSDVGFLNPASVAGINLLGPFIPIERGFELNMEEIRSGKEKRILRELFYERTGLEAPGKQAFTRPVSVWKQYYGPIVNTDEIREDAYERVSTDNQRWLIYTLDHWLYLYKNNCFKHYDVGYTTGVYDMFHMGHLNVIRRASKMVDKLVVGVTNDALVSYKNKQSIIRFEDRIRIVRALPFVSMAVEQSDMDKAKACKRYGAHAIIVGDDWKNTEKWNNYEKELKEIGVEVVYLPYTKRVSSTILRKEIGK